MSLYHIPPNYHQKCLYEAHEVWVVLSAVRRLRRRRVLIPLRNVSTATTPFQDAGKINKLCVPQDGQGATHGQSYVAPPPSGVSTTNVQDIRHT